MSLLSVVYKILERLILQRIQPLIEAAVPVSQAGFQKNRSCTEQVMALTSHIEAGFERKLKTGTIFIDLTAALERRTNAEIHACGIMFQNFQASLQHAVEP
jgi:hypothetical protein